MSSASLWTLGEHTLCQELPKRCAQMVSCGEFLSSVCLLYLFALKPMDGGAW